MNKSARSISFSLNAGLICSDFVLLSWQRLADNSLDIRVTNLSSVSVGISEKLERNLAVCATTKPLVVRR